MSIKNSSQKIKVVHMCTYSEGGAATAAFRIHEALLKSEIDSSFLTLDMLENPSRYPLPDDISFFKKLEDKVRWRLKTHFNIKVKTREDFTRELNLVKPLLKFDYVSLPFSEFDLLHHPLVKEADIIHLHWVAEMMDYPTFFRKNETPVVWTLHDMNPFQGIYHYKQDEITNEALTGKLNAALLRIKKRAICRRKTRLSIVCPSAWLLKAAEASGNFKKAKFYQIAYPLNLEIFKPVQADALRAARGVPVENTVFLFVAQDLNNYRKGFDLIRDAFRTLIHLPVTLLVVGKAEAQEINGLDIRLLGPINDDILLAEYYSMADAFIIPSREDNLPNVMLESMACGTPVLSFNVGGMSEYIEDEFNGLKATKTESAELIKIIKNFIDNKSKYDAMAIRNFALQNFSEEKIAEKYKRVYADILS